MKAVVVELKGKYAIAVTKKGSFLKIRSKPEYQLGFEIDAPDMFKSNRNFYMKAASIAAGLILVGSVSFGAYAYNTPYSYINVDINPSVELTVNRFDRVIGAKGLNEDGQRVLSEQALKNKNVRDSVDLIVKQAFEQGYLSKDKEGAVLLSVASRNEDKADKIKNDLEEETREEVNTTGVKVEVLSQNIALKRIEEARDLSISPGKLNLIQKLQEAAEAVEQNKSQSTTAGTASSGENDKYDYSDTEFWSKQPVQDIMKAAKDLRIDLKDEKNDNKSNNGNLKNKDKKSDSLNSEPSPTPKKASTPTPTPTPKPKPGSNGKGAGQSKD